MDIINSDVDVLWLQRLEKDEFTVNKCEYITYRIHYFKGGTNRSYE